MLNAVKHNLVAFAATTAICRVIFTCSRSPFTVAEVPLGSRSSRIFRGATVEADRLACSGCALPETSGLPSCLRALHLLSVLAIVGPLRRRSRALVARPDCDLVAARFSGDAASSRRDVDWIPGHAADRTWGAGRPLTTRCSSVTLCRSSCNTITCVSQDERPGARRYYT